MTEEVSQTQLVLNWLDSVGLGESGDPTVLMLVSAVREFEALEDSDLSEKDKLAARKNLRTNINTSRKTVEDLLDKADSARTAERYRFIYGTIANRTMGWVEATMLSEKLQAAIAKELEERHNITDDTLKPMIAEL